MPLQFHPRLSAISRTAWDALAGSQPFVGHTFLSLLEDTGCVGGDSGWQPCHAVLEEQGRLLAAMPLYLKEHSWGEYVFDWSWAQASERAGLPYYPKLLAAIPFTPVPGARLLGRDDEQRARLLQGVLQRARQQGLSGLHCLFPRTEDLPLLQQAGMLQRQGVQFHWRNPGYTSYDQFLAQLNHDKRKKLKQERRRVQESGLRLQRKTGSEILEADWAFFHRCYRHTYSQHRSTPYLNLQFFLQLGQRLPQHCLLVLAYRDQQPIAAALDLYDDSRLYGRYWGALEYQPNLHFELCYHQGMEFAIERGLAVFEGGAQGEHKLARGFEAVTTSSWHALTEPALATAVGRFLQQERLGVQQYVSELEERAPYSRLALSAAKPNA